MIITDRFVYIHQPKTGGTFVTSVLERLHGDGRPRGMVHRVLRQPPRGGMLNIRKHGTCKDIPFLHRRKPIVATARNPYDWYVSVYEFGWWKTHPIPGCDEDEARERYPHFPDLAFGEFLNLAMERFVMRGTTPARNELRLGYYTRLFVRFYFRNVPSVFEELLDGQHGGIDYTRYLYPGRFLHTNRLNQDLFDCLMAFGYDPASIGFVRDMERVLPPEGGRATDQRWERYYTPELKAMVRERDRLVFTLFPGFDT